MANYLLCWLEVHIIKKVRDIIKEKGTWAGLNKPELESSKIAVFAARKIKPNAGGIITAKD